MFVGGWQLSKVTVNGFKLRFDLAKLFNEVPEGKSKDRQTQNLLVVILPSLGPLTDSTM